MFSGDLRASQKKLAQRAKAEREQAKRKAEKEKLLAERAALRAAALEEQKRKVRLEQIQREEEERLLIEHDRERNRGVVWRGKLLAVPAASEIASAKGIRRAADKVLLPRSVGDNLLQQDAMKNGPYFFELKSIKTGRKTHAALLEFSAAEGFIGLPEKVVRCLFGVDASPDGCDGQLDVAYCTLPKGTRVVFQPRSAEFQSTIGDNIREILEETLAQHSVLTVGDWIKVPVTSSEKTFYDLRVKELEPSDAVSVIETEMEADVLISVETEEKLAQEEEKARQHAEEVARLQKEAELVALQAEEIASQKSLEKKKRMEESTASLPEEPSAVDGSDVIRCLIRFPNGERYSRNFLPSDPLSLLFMFVDSKGASDREPNAYRLVTQFPRLVVDPPKDGDKDPKFRDLDLHGHQAVFFLEDI